MEKEVIPNRVWFSLTGRCNNMCLWCHRKGSEVKRFLRSDTVLQFAQTLAASGAKACTLAGGEPTLHPDCLALAGQLARIFKSCALVTNGRMLTGPLPDDFVIGKVNVTISIHGASPDHYEKNTGSKNGFDEAVRGARNLQAHGLRPSLSVVLGPENIAHSAEFVELAKELKANALGFTIAIPSIDVPDYVPAPADVPDTVAKLHEICTAAGLRHVFIYSLPWCTLQPAMLEELINSRSIMFDCPVPGGKVLVIKENGALGLCTHTTSFELLDAKETCEVMTTPARFLEFWGSTQMHDLRRAVDVDRHPNCSTCAYHDHCKGGCPLWWKFFDFGDTIAKRGGDNHDAESRESS